MEYIVHDGGGLGEALLLHLSSLHGAKLGDVAEHRRAHLGAKILQKGHHLFK